MFAVYKWNPHPKLALFLLNCLLLLNHIRSTGGYFQSYEDDLVNEFRTMVEDITTKDYMTSKGYLLRWLKVHDFDLDETLEKFKESMQWRKDNGIDTILREDFTSVDEIYPFALEGTDKDGRPVAWAPVGAYDIRKIVIAGEQELYQRYMMRMLELMEVHLYHLRQTTGRDNITQAIMLFDLGGFNVKTGACLRCLKMVPEFTTNVERNYPNILFKAYHVNTPQLFESVFRLARGLMSAETKDAIQIYDYDKDKWTAALLQQIPADQLPVQYGGTKPFDYYTMAANRKPIISSIIAFSETDSHFAPDEERLAADRPEQPAEEELEPPHHRTHTRPEKAHDSDLTVNSISRRHMDSADPLETETIVETIPGKDLADEKPMLTHGGGGSSSAPLIASSSLSQRAIPDTISASTSTTTSSTELPHLVRHHKKHRHHHHYQDVPPPDDMQGESYKSRRLYLRSGASSSLFTQLSVSQYSRYALLPFVTIFCLSWYS